MINHDVVVARFARALDYIPYVVSTCRSLVGPRPTYSVLSHTLGLATAAAACAEPTLVLQLILSCAVREWFGF